MSPQLSQNILLAARLWPVAVVAILAWLSIVVSVDPGGSYPHLPQGPGLTVDEIFNVEQGVYLVEQARSLGWLNLIPGTSQEAYRPGNGLYNPDHPPLGRWWLGIHHELTFWFFPPNNPDGRFVTACARTGSATAFALTIFLLGSCATTWSGPAVGAMTAISLVMMPRVYGHAHLASLETITNLSCTAAVLAVAAWWTGPSVPTRRVAILSGLLLGLALLTKIQAVLIPIPVIAWALWRWRTSAIIPLALWSATGLVAFFLLWPYLWFDPIAHGMEYLGRTTNRATLHVWYFGRVYADKAVPWHYPFVMFSVTIPLVLHGLGLLGLVEPSPSVAKVNRGRDLLIFGCLSFPLVVFAVPGVAVYDCERLFLTAFPLWAIYVGRGWLTCWHLLAGCFRSVPARNAVCVTLGFIVTWPLLEMAPCHLCYYNSLVSLLPDSANGRPALETDYWGVGMTRELLTNIATTVPEGTAVAIVPTLHQFQAEDYHRQSPVLRANGIETVEYHPDKSPPRYCLVYCRFADLPEQWNFADSDQLLAVTMRGNRLIAYLIRKSP